MRQVHMGMTETEVPADVRDGEWLEVIRLGGPRDGARFGYARAEVRGDELVLHLEPAGEQPPEGS